MTTLANYQNAYQAMTAYAMGLVELFQNRFPGEQVPDPIQPLHDEAIRTGKLIKDVE